MIDCYAAGTTNGQRAVCVLEESGLPYRLHDVDIAAGEHKSASFLALNPAGQVPVIVDPDGPSGQPLTLAQSGAICIYVAEKSGHLLPRGAARKAQAVRWLMFVLTDLGATATSLFHLSLMKSPPEDAIALLRARLQNFLRLADAQLATDGNFIGEFSVADVALYPLMGFPVVRAALEGIPELVHLKQWQAAMAARPAIAQAMNSMPAPGSRTRAPA